MLVVQARSLFAKWKQIVYIDFDKNMTPQILFHIIQKLQTINYKVIVCVSDCNENSIDLWRSLSVSIDETWFLNPVTNEKIYVFIDAPCLLNLLHSQFIETGFSWNDKVINKNWIVDLITISNQKGNSFCKLTEEHLTNKENGRNTKKLSKELFSCMTVNALRHYFRNNQTFEQVADFFELVNNWFDIFSSTSLNSNDPTKASFGSYLNEQTRILNTFFDEILNMRCGNVETLESVQECILLSINSLVFLQKDISNYDQSCIATQKLNQDTLVNLFNQLKKVSNSDDLPTPLHALNKLRMIILDKTSELKKGTEADQINEEFIVSSVLSKSGIDVNKKKLPESSKKRKRPTESIEENDSDASEETNGNDKEVI